jgi:hypothetical protein
LKLDLGLGRHRPTTAAHKPGIDDQPATRAALRHQEPCQEPALFGLSAQRRSIAEPSYIPAGSHWSTGARPFPWSAMPVWEEHLSGERQSELLDRAIREALIAGVNETCRAVGSVSSGSASFGDVTLTVEN